MNLLIATLLIMSPNTEQNTVLKFSDLDWSIKRSEAPVGPGPNLFGVAPRGAFVDEKGRLHLRIQKTAKGWDCSEVVLNKHLGYGTYTFVVSTPPCQIDDRAILGLFTYGADPEFEHREIDVEVSRWGDASLPNTQFVVQPYQVAENIHRFEVPKGLQDVQFKFVWKPDSVSFRAASESFIKEWTFSRQKVPVPKDEAVRINYWLMGGQPPAVPRTYEVVISRFSFKKL